MSCWISLSTRPYGCSYYPQQVAIRRQRMSHTVAGLPTNPTTKSYSCGWSIRWRNSEECIYVLWYHGCAWRRAHITWKYRLGQSNYKWSCCWMPGLTNCSSHSHLTGMFEILNTWFGKELSLVKRRSRLQFKYGQAILHVNSRPDNHIVLNS